MTVARLFPDKKYVSTSRLPLRFGALINALFTHYLLNNKQRYSLFSAELLGIR
uniref:hypothetical protein n=1 Tax=Candidatus Pantoea varia TaxID=1881036 RepID=UPI0015877122|nr:hypothetical protein [Pantoea varia]